MRVSRPAAPLGVAGFILSCGLVASSPPGLPAVPFAPGSHPASRLHVVGPPPGHTGGFGEPTCAVCHLGSDLNEPGSTLEIDGLDGQYVPGRSYRVTIRLLSFDMDAAGFQGAFRWVEGDRAGTSAGRVRALDDRVAVVEGGLARVPYVQHTQAGAPADGERAVWTFEWTAPRETGPIELHLAANSGNGDNSPLDDLVYTAAVGLTPVAGPDGPGRR